ncbi:DUF6452 family protein [Flavobacteriaceae bacterium]|jgi:hypothetical protein|nr:DUF6452 family protein [Flavobacteriaceae bacterium]MDA9318842.1 DUF6452 family protein [Flavobacteriaceae bacterium]MDB0042439.1 DUF6452 family protein [Flavobacteriaceae bacterium]MDB4093323.1 DUF6452 family protein [Flavobacteriaceae bacterium]MDB9793564.1 DUF6452 family protein [Flavobacteriaceae bacterium]|tara:strand:+ start:11762 stop:12253 length:492 start_codon:yes stop_codon:yes gene_type:complete
MKLLKNNFILLGLFVFLLSCEPDDICLTSIEDTPKLIIGFYDKSTGELKEVTNLKIQGHNNEEVYIYQTIDSIGIPLKNLDNLTIYSLTKDFNENTSNSGNKDDLYINYNYNWEYISRACGFKTTYELKNLIIENDSNNWILDTDLINNIIIDEKNIHVKIFH